MKPVSFSRILSHWAARKPDATALVLDEEALTWSDIDARTNRLARAYADLGVKQDDFVTVGLPNSIAFVEACFAIWKLGATPQPVSHRLPDVELEAIVTLADPALVIGALGKGSACPQLPPDFQPELSVSDEPLEERTSSRVKAVTSGGSTGRPKLIVMPVPAQWDLSYRNLTVPHESTVLIPGPLYHNGPFLWMVSSLCQGNRTVLMKKFDAERTLQLLQNYAVEDVYMVPTMMQRIWNLPEAVRCSYDLSALKSLIHMAGPCPAWLKNAFIDWLGPDVIWEFYGGTEGQAGTLISGGEWLKHRGSVGKPIAAMGEIKVLSDEGRELGPGEVGEIFMRPAGGPGSTYTYIGAEPRARDDGWESLGDMGFFDADGYLYLADRRTDMIVSGGANVYPAEVEAAIEEYPGIRSCAVIGLPHEDMGNAVHAIIDAPGIEISEDAMLTFLRKRLVTYKLPRTVEFASEPLRDDAGKVRRSALREARISQPIVRN